MKIAGASRSIFSPVASIPNARPCFMQSDVPQVTELAWILSTVAPMGLLERAHSYKDKVARGMAATAGLFNYPVLMAADILIYDSDVVPVGKDQKQHIEITRDLAGKINETYGQSCSKLPEPRIQAATEVVPGIDAQKMSKSYNNTIDIFGDEKETRKRVMSIVTDSTPVEASKDPAKSTIVQLYSLFASQDESPTCENDLRKAALVTAISKNSSSKNSGNFSRRCANAAKKSWPTNRISTMSSFAARREPTKLRTTS